MKIVLFIFLLPSFIFAKDGAFRYFISFTDKSNTPFSIYFPQEYLSEKTINKRLKFSIPIDSTDLPVNKHYVDVLTSVGLKIENKSKWLNGVVVSTFDSLIIQTLNHQFIDTIINFGSWQNSKKVDKKWQSNYNRADYHAAHNQLKMLGGDKMHAKGYVGRGITIAVIDAGFYKVNELDVFNDLRDQIIATYDFVDGSTNVYDDHIHGTMVLSTMGAKESGMIIGTAPEAEYLLLRSEDVFSENLIEEYMWVCAAEFADSVGADIINSSLGYTVFDNENQNHTYADMDGNTAPVSIGAGIACSKGIIVVNSAGNSGNNNWHYIGAPADHLDVLTVGAVDESKNLASFSSNGPNAEGSIKPNIVAQGKNTIVVNSNNESSTVNGTSFSSPITAGMVACLWAANPHKKAMEIKDAIYKSSDKYFSPDNQFGYGIPDYYNALKSLSSEISFEQIGGFFNFTSNIETKVEYVVYSIDGKIISKGSFFAPFFWEDIKPKSVGTYIIKFMYLDYTFSKKFIVFE
tara:strand:- start:20995 stop:22548 length:1554 start_codon:yes stop_codon:yes gene_type:complete